MHRQDNRTCEESFAPSALVVLSLALVTLLVNTAHPVTIELLHMGNGFSAGSDLSRPLGLFYDRHSNECYVADTGNHQVVVFDQNGLPVFRFYHHITLNGQRRLGEPKSLVVDSDGRIFITDALVPYLDVLDRNGRTITTVDPPGDRCGEYVRFDGVAIGGDDKIYASLSCGEERLVVSIGPDLELKKVITLKADHLGATCMTALDVDEDGNIYVTDPCAELMVQIYDPEGSYVTGFGKHDSGFENFSHPSGISVMPSGEMWIVDSIRQVVSCFESGGEFISYVGGKGTHPGAFNYPSGIDTDGKDRLFVVERAGNRYQCFRIVYDDGDKVGE